MEKDPIEELEELQEPELDFDKDVELLPKPVRKTREQDIWQHRPSINA